MKVKFSPVRSDKSIKYAFEGDTISAKYEGTDETYDFSGFPNGEAVMSEIETILPFNPIVSAKRVDGILYVELINYIGADASYEERFPDWFDPSDPSDPVEEVEINE